MARVRRRGVQVEALLLQLADTPSAAFGIHRIMLHARATEGQWLRPSQVRVPHVMRSDLSHFVATPALTVGLQAGHLEEANLSAQ
jgi:hypothetical protein